MVYTQLKESDLEGNKKLKAVWELVCSAHATQKRKGLDKKAQHPDYVVHPFRVLEILMNSFGNPKDVIHDEKYLPMFSSGS